jgi:hypothetical protein
VQGGKPLVFGLGGGVGEQARKPGGVDVHALAEALRVGAGDLLGGSGGDGSGAS